MSEKLSIATVTLASITEVGKNFDTIQVKLKVCLMTLNQRCPLTALLVLGPTI